MKLKVNDILTIIFAWGGALMVAGGLCAHTYLAALLGGLSMGIAIMIVAQKEFGIFNKKK